MFSRARTFLECCRCACARFVALACVLLPATGNAQGTAIFQIDDVPGEIHLSDRADARAGVDVRRIVVLRGDAGRPATRGAATHPFADVINTVAMTERLPPALIGAVIAVESAWRVRALSPRGAAGLMQLMPATAKSYGVTDIFDPAQNIAAGGHHLRVLLDRYDQDVARTLAAYNAGAAAVDRAGAHRHDWPRETAAYVPAVLGRFAAQEPPPSSSATLDAGL